MGPAVKAPASTLPVKHALAAMKATAKTVTFMRELFVRGIMRATPTLCNLWIKLNARPATYQALLRHMKNGKQGLLHFRNHLLQSQQMPQSPYLNQSRTVVFCSETNRIAITFQIFFEILRSARVSCALAAQTHAICAVRLLVARARMRGIARLATEAGRAQDRTAGAEWLCLINAGCAVPTESLSGSWAQASSNLGWNLL